MITLWRHLGFAIITAMSLQSLAFAAEPEGSAADEPTVDVVPYPQASELKNRFRIDHMVDELTLIVQRSFGSAPVVIIQPDGSKWYASRHPNTVKWTDSEAGDVIKIEHPTPGPWQLTGKIIPGSKIVRLSRLGIEIEPFPQPLYQGETLKLRAWLTGDDLRLRLPGLAYMVTWNATFSSQQNKEEANFASGTFGVGTYQDNGSGLDEQPDDGVFTSKINLDQPWGHYLLKVDAFNEVFSRNYEQQFVLSKMPADISVVEPEKPTEQPWELKLVADGEQLDLTQTYFNLTVVGPAGFQSSISERLEGLTEKELVLSDVTEFGSYRIKGTMFSTISATGREIVVNLPERFFNYIQPPEPPPSPAEIAAREAAVAKVEEAQAKTSAVTMVIVGNILLLLLGAGLMLFLRKRQSLKLALAAAEAAAAEKTAETDDSPDVRDIDLAMPDDNEKQG